MRWRVRLCQYEGMALTLQTSFVNQNQKRTKAFQKNKKRLLLATNLRSVNLLSSLQRDIKNYLSSVENYCLLERHDGDTLAFDSFPTAIGL